MVESTLPYPMIKNDITKLDVSIKIGTVDDLPFICHTWMMMMKHMYPNNHAFDFEQKFMKMVHQLLDKSVVLVAHLDDDPQYLISFLVYSSFRNQQVIHYLYTKLDARHQGIAQQLLDFSNPTKLPVIFTFPPKTESSMKRFCAKGIYDPSLLGLL